MDITLRAGTCERLTRHVCGQLAMFYPLSDQESDIRTIETYLGKALERVSSIVSVTRSFTPGHFDHLNTLQYASFLYLLSNTIWRSSPEDDIVDRLFGLNRALSGLELFPAVNLPEPFFLSHALGAVLGNATYGRHLVIFQNVTVGRVGDSRPTIGDRVILFAGASVTGKAAIGPGSVVSAGVCVHNVAIPPESLVASGSDGLEVRPLRRDYHSLYFR